jgi:ATP phosphoribosyltransferase regulatory subunit
MSSSSISLATAQAHIPRGVADYFWSEAAARRDLEHQLIALFRTWGYHDVIPPTFEYAETFQHRASPRLQAEMYRFLDRDGSTLALRADMTIPVARLVGVRLHDWPMPQRFCYAGSVFRYVDPQAGRQREFTQAGFELIGARSPEADAEVLALTVQAVRRAGIGDFRLVLGQIQYFDGLLRDLKLSPKDADQFQRAVNRNSEADLAEFLRQAPLRTQQRHTVEQLPRLSGPDVPAIIAQADRLCLNYDMHQALDNLRQIHRVLDAYGVADTVYLDLTEINNLGYYTGITFEVLIPGLGFAVGSGGRYDNLIGTFGSAQPAVGVALGLDRLLASARGTRSSGQTQPVAPHLLIATDNNPICLRVVDAWRRAGLRVAVSVDGLKGAELAQSARRLAVPLAATWTVDGFELWRTADSATAGPTYVPAAEATGVVALATGATAGGQFVAQASKE